MVFLARKQGRSGMPCRNFALKTSKDGDEGFSPIRFGQKTKRNGREQDEPHDV